MNITINLFKMYITSQKWLMLQRGWIKLFWGRWGDFDVCVCLPKTIVCLPKTTVYLPKMIFCQKRSFFAKKHCWKRCWFLLIVCYQKRPFVRQKRPFVKVFGNKFAKNVCQKRSLVKNDRLLPKNIAKNDGLSS